jgi:c-di-GMP-related signal transduction protein
MEARLQAEAHVTQWRATVDSMLDPVLVLVPLRDTAGQICEFTFTVANAAAAVEAKGLGRETVAEGVEEDEQLRMLSEQGWQSGQGWLFGKPEPL